MRFWDQFWVGVKFGLDFMFGVPRLRTPEPEAAKPPRSRASKAEAKSKGEAKPKAKRARKSG